MAGWVKGRFYILRPVRVQVYQRQCKFPVTGPETTGFRLPSIHWDTTIIVYFLFGVRSQTGWGWGGKTLTRVKGEGMKGWMPQLPNVQNILTPHLKVCELAH